MKALAAILRRDVMLALRQGNGLGPAIGFVLAVMVLVPLAIGPDQALLQRLAPGMAWISLLLAVILTAERIFSHDLEDGTLDLMAMSPLPLELVCFIKMISHWLLVSLPLAVLLPFLSLMLNLDTGSLPVLLIAMLTGSAALSALAAIGAAVTAGLKRGGLLITLLVLPLYVPVIIFGVSVTVAMMSPDGGGAPLLVLAGLALLAVVVSPWAAAAALRIYLRG